MICQFLQAKPFRERVYSLWLYIFMFTCFLLIKLHSVVTGTRIEIGEQAGSKGRPVQVIKLNVDLDGFD